MVCFQIPFIYFLGTVAAFKDENTDEKFAIKKIKAAFTDLTDARRILREIKVLSHLNHENIIQIRDVLPPRNPFDEDIYIVTELMETDLYKVITSRQELSDEHCRYFIYQMLRGLLYLHSAKVLHRDLKPSNILLNRNCDVKICDLGLARHYNEEEPSAQDQNLTDYVVTRWYRSPEVVLDPANYKQSMDVWAIGCIFCEILGRRPLFDGRDHMDQLKRIFEVIGYPSEEEMCWLPQGGTARLFMSRLPRHRSIPLNELYPHANPLALDFIAQTLKFNPHERISVMEALRHPYFAPLHTPGDEPLCETEIDWTFDDLPHPLNKRDLMNRMYIEIAIRHPDILIRDHQLIAECGIRPPSHLIELGKRLWAKNDLHQDRHHHKQQQLHKSVQPGAHVSHQSGYSHPSQQQQQRHGGGNSDHHHTATGH